MNLYTLLLWHFTSNLKHVHRPLFPNWPQFSVVLRRWGECYQEKSLGHTNTSFTHHLLSQPHLSPCEIFYFDQVNINLMYLWFDTLEENQCISERQRTGLSQRDLTAAAGLDMPEKVILKESLSKCTVKILIFKDPHTLCAVIMLAASQPRRLQLVIFELKLIQFLSSLS